MRGSLLLVSCLSLGCANRESSPQADVDAGTLPGVTMKLQSSAFEPDGAMDARFTCEGEDISPPLSWSDVPDGTESFALIIDDPDAPDPAAPQRVWVHWVLYDMPADTRALAEGAAESGLPRGTRVGTNDWKRTDYGGPCPPTGRHRYFHRVYALDTVLGLGAATKAELLAAMEAHVLGTGELVGTYQKKGS